MLSRVVPVVLLLASALLMWGCSQRPDLSSGYFTAKPEPWREVEERSCLAGGGVRESRFLVATNRAASGASALGGPAPASPFCGAIHPFEMSGTSDGRVQLQPAAVLRCEMVGPFERWVAMVVEPEVFRIYGAHLDRLTVAASYGCRPIDNIAGKALSEHGHANAVDISAFQLSNGLRVTVKEGWHANARDHAFLRAVFDGACREFTTVLGPDGDRFHQDHIHMDLARHGRDGNQHYCH